MSEEPVVTIIVPVYNVDKYLGRCIESILSQTFTDFELLLIDDGSNDECPSIIDAYASRDSRVVAVHQSNQGVSAARNHGLSMARGTFVGFVDADDWIEPEMYESMITQATSYDADIVACGYTHSFDAMQDVDHELALPNTMTGKCFASQLFARPRTIGGSVCNKLFRRRLILQGFDERYVICEDNLFLGIYCLMVNRAAIVQAPMYHVYARSDSTIRSSPTNVFYGLEPRRVLIDEMAILGKDVKRDAQEDYLDTCAMLAFKFRKESDIDCYRGARYKYIDYLPTYLIEQFRLNRLILNKMLRFTYFYLRFVIDSVLDGSIAD